VTETIKLLELPEDLQDKVHSGEISREDGIFLAAKIEPEQRHAVLAEALVIAAERIQKKSPVVEPTPEVEGEVEAAPAEPTAPGAAPVAPAVVPAPGKTAPVAAPVSPAPKGGKTAPAPKAGKAAPVTKTRNVAKVTHGDIVKAAERTGALDPATAPARKMTEVVRFFKELIETSPDSSFASQFAKDFLRWKDRKLKDETFENKIYEYTHTKLGTVVSEGKGGKKK
jgi:hypothetical protein